MEFEWAPEKAARNFRKHGVSFDEAATVFGDPLSATASDPDHAFQEHRFITVRRPAIGHLLMVAHADRSGKTRLISTRKLTRNERKAYGEIE